MFSISKNIHHHQSEASDTRTARISSLLSKFNILMSITCRTYFNHRLASKLSLFLSNVNGSKFFVSFTPEISNGEKYFIVTRKY